MGKFLNGELTNDCIQESGNLKILLSITDGRLGMYWIRLRSKASLRGRGGARAVMP
jgi:hypothetical protein